MLLGYLLGIATAVIWGSGDFLSRKPSAAIGSMLTSILIQPVGLTIMLLAFLLDSGIGSLARIISSPADLAINLGIGIIAFFGIVFLFRGYVEGVMSIVAPIAGAFPVVSVSLSILLLGISLTPVRSLSIMAVIVGIVLAGVKLSPFRQLTGEPKSIADTDKRKLIRGADYGIGAMLCAGFGLFGLGVVGPVIGSILAVVILKFSETITGFGTLFFARVRLVRPNLRTFALVAIVGACDAVGFLTYNLAVSSGGADLPIVVTLAGLTGVVTVLLARLFYAERLEKVQIVGVIIIFAAVAAILYF